ncbi:MAG: class I SAM-dependent methyltransferase [Acidimicrobiales bacterium]
MRPAAQVLLPRRARKAARGVVRNLPEPAQRVVRGLARRLDRSMARWQAGGPDGTVGRPARPVAQARLTVYQHPPPPPPVAFPQDVADAEALRARLCQTDVFGEAREEAAGYLAGSLERVRITMALLPPLPTGARVLELGANPYFLTRLLRERGLDVRGANWFGRQAGFGPVGRQTVVESGVAHTYEFDHFNLEADPFPYPDSTFDLVLFCEIIEHLPFDVVQPLAEVHRVLRPGGALLLTTPNAVRLDNVERILRGDNVYETLSGYGPYGRHNREYTVSELRALLEEGGYEVAELQAMDIDMTAPHGPAVPGMAPEHRGENLFALARPTGLPRWHYPPWLYSSRQAIWRVALPELVVGRNDEVQSRGLLPLEETGGRPVRWTGEAPATTVVVADGEDSDSGDAVAGRLVVEGVAPPAEAGPVIRLSAKLGDQALSWSVRCDGEPFSVDAAVTCRPGHHQVELRAAPLWRPAGGPEEPRGLGVFRVSLVTRDG